jgi:acrylyl-CoA reductase (NADPH)
MTEFAAYYATKSDKGPKIEKARLTTDDLMPGNVTVRVEYSTINYKDALAMTGSSPILRKLPIVPGIDLAGEVVESQDSRYKAGDKVLLTGYGLGETHSGGFAQMARVDGDWLVPVPDKLDTRLAMAIGTAGFTAMLCILTLEHHGTRPESGPILVTGATGGVGSIAVAVLNKLGYSVSAVTGKMQESDYLTKLGAHEIIDRSELSGKAKILDREKWSAAVDVAGGNILANVLSQTQRGGAVAACGLAASMELPSSVAPFILRGVTLYGIDSVMCPMQKRGIAWQRLAYELDQQLLESMITEIGFDDIPAVAGDLMAGKAKGRIVVRIQD